ncbi:endolysin [Vibrio phage PVA1]|uniref:endolysin n=1 Tax=Vibrio phage PVA1 TaxID=1461743 RepID=UPI0003F217CC|nr:endolysin [Vibrio phage PVA1]AHJ87874.1 putative lysozyme family protein [Vibrio phage PVA1]
MFYKSFERVIGHEGGYTDDPNDRGNWTSGKVGEGELKGTKFGISAMSYPHLDIKNLTLDEAQAIYFNDFWVKDGIDQLPKAMQYQMFDASINHGFRNATKMLQRAVDVADDGIIGKNTMKAVGQYDQLNLVLLFNNERLKFYTDIRTWSQYGKGWARRVAGNLKLGSEDAE